MNIGDWPLMTLEFLNGLTLKPEGVMTKWEIEDVKALIACNPIGMASVRKLLDAYFLDRHLESELHMEPRTAVYHGDGALYPVVPTDWVIRDWRRSPQPPLCRVLDAFSGREIFHVFFVAYPPNQERRFGLVGRHESEWYGSLLVRPGETRVRQIWQYRQFTLEAVPATVRAELPAADAADQPIEVQAGE